MQVKSWLKASEKFVSDNSPALLTAVGVVGTISTAVLTGRATFRAADILREDHDLEKKHPTMHFEPRSFKRDVKLVWKLYIPPLAVGAITTASIVCANRVGTRRAAALASAYGVSEKAFNEYREKVTEQLGANKERQIRDDINQDRVRNNPGSEVMVTGEGESKFYDKYSGRYFVSTMEEVKKAQNHLNHSLLNNGYASVNDFYSWVGLNSIPAGEEFGWNSDKLLECHFSAIIDENDKPCIVVDFRAEPIRNYYKKF